MSKGIEGKETEEIDINKHFHEVLGNVDELFWFFFLSNWVLGDHDIQTLIDRKASSAVNNEVSIATSGGELKALLERYKSWVGMETKVDYSRKTYETNMNPLEGSVMIARVMTITAYELLKESNYFDEIKDLEELKFLRHLRNGAAHDNRFSLCNKRGDWTIGQEETIRWRWLDIKRELDGKPIFNDYVSFSGVFLLVDDISEKLKQIDSSED